MLARVWLLVSAVLITAAPSAHGRAAPPPGSDPVGGSPPPAGRVAPDEDVFRYKGQFIPRDTAAERGLACYKEDAATPTRCYDSESTLSSAEGVATLAPSRPQQVRAARAEAARRHARRSRGSSRKRAAKETPHGHAANHYGTQYPLGLWQHSDHQGWYVATNSYCQWFNLTGFYANNTSSTSAGQHTGYASKDPGGFGDVYAVAAWYDHNYVGDSWNDSFEARSRVCL